MTERILITSEPGADITDYALNAVLDTVKSDGLDSFLVIAPDFDFLEMFKYQLISKGDINGLFNSSFITFRDFNKGIVPSLKIIPVSLKRLILKDILRDPELDLQNLPYMSGFRRRVDNLFNEITSHEPETRESLLNTLQSRYPNGLTGNAIISKLVTAYRNFNQRLENLGFDTQESSLHKAASMLNESDTGSRLFIIGFHEFDRAQINMLKALAKTDRDILITLPVDSESQMQKETINELATCGYQLKELPVIDKNSLNPERKQLFSKYDEADYIARRVAGFIENGFKPEEIIIIHPKPLPALKHFRSAFEHLDIPLKTALPQPLREISPIRELMSMLELLSGNLDHAKSLTSSKFSESMADLALYLNDNELESLIDGEDIDRPEPIKPKIWNRFINYIKQSREITDFDDFKHLINSLKQEFRIDPERMSEEPEKLTALAWRTFFHNILVTLSEYYKGSDYNSDIQQSFSDFFLELRDQVDNTIIRPRNPRRSAVEFVSFENAILKSPKIVILTGMSQVLFPKKPPRDPLLGDSIRNELKSSGFSLNTAHDYYAHDRFLLNHILNLASEKTLITAPMQDDDGEQVNISIPIISKYPDGWDTVFNPVSDILTRDDLLSKIAIYYGDNDTDEKSEEIKQQINSFYPRGHRALMSNINFDEDINRDLLKTYTDANRPYSATGLNNYAQCPFKYLAGYVMNLSGSPYTLERVLTPLVRGDLIHDLLSRRVCKDPENVSLKNLLIEKNIDPKTLSFQEEAQLESYNVTLEMFINDELERIENEGRELYAAELPFGMWGWKEVKISILGKYRHFRGRIDRIDKLSDGTYIVIDYKTSSRGINELFKEASVFQLPFYVLATDFLGMKASKVEIINISSGKFSYMIQDAHDPDGFKRIEDIIGMIDSGLFPVKPAETAYCGWDSCDYYHVCRINQ